MAKKNVQSIVDDKLCMGCGICQDSCPKKCITIEHGKTSVCPIVYQNDCIDCGLCLMSCPGKGLKLKEEGQSLFSAKHNRYVGAYLKSYTGWSMDKNIRFHSASGGVVTQFLIYLLDKGLIDGAIVVGVSANNKMLSKAFVAKTKEEILHAKSSKYVTTSVEGVMSDIKAHPGRYVCVGLPCHIQAYRLFAKTHKFARERIIGYFAIYCSLNKIDLSADYYSYRYKFHYSNIKRFAYRDDGCMGYMKFEGYDGNVKKIPYVHFWLGSHSFFINKRCLVCNDHFGELADISFGDVNIPPYNEDKVGINSIVSRSEYWDSLLHTALNDRYLHIEELSLDELIKCQEYVKRHKKGKGIAAERIIRKLVGWKNPVNDDKTVAFSFACFMKQFLAWVMIAMGRHRSLWFIVKAFDRYGD